MMNYLNHYNFNISQIKNDKKLLELYLQNIQLFMKAIEDHNKISYFFFIIFILKNNYAFNLLIKFFQSINQKTNYLREINTI